VRALASFAPFLGLGLLAAILWGAIARLDRWEARSFVLLYYGAVICAGVSQLGRLLTLRRLPPLVRDARGTLTTVVLVLAAWFWAPGVRSFVNWAIRRGSALLLD
jgi:hypothetical protein